MDFLIVLAALAFLMFVAYRGYSVILFAPIAALGAVLFVDPNLVAPMFTGLFMDKMVGFVKNFFPVFLLGAVFGKVIELSGFSKSIVAAVIRMIGRERAMLAFAHKLTAEPWAVEEYDRAALRKVGFSDRDIWDIAATAAFYNMSNRLAAATDMRPNREYHFMARDKPKA